MVTLMPAIAVVFVSFLYCAYDHVRQSEVRRRLRVVRERVAELLWAAAERGS
ncbi:MAG: hypothetical protein ACRC33_28455 [Gemmataceae bacterium]